LNFFLRNEDILFRGRAAEEMNKDRSIEGEIKYDYYF
jgi:hypothetical protein